MAFVLRSDALPATNPLFGGKTGLPVFHIKMGRPVKCFAQGQNKQTCWLVLHNLPLKAERQAESCEYHFLKSFGMTRQGEGIPGLPTTERTLLLLRYRVDGSLNLCWTHFGKYTCGTVSIGVSFQCGSGAMLYDSFHAKSLKSSLPVTETIRRECLVG